MESSAESVERGHRLLAQLSNAIVQVQKEYWGKGPDRAKSYLLDDFLLVVLRGGLTKAEETMLDVGEGDRVRDFRQTWQNRAAARYIGLIEELTGRKVVTYQSQILFGPTILLEIFFFEGSAAGDGSTIATAVAQLDVRSADAIRDDASAA
ncbi:MAG: DUF2294 family protein [Solirubrobacterales bacterium]|jgi:uncharacterized protein YbcI|nr:DUF2294 family protein [Solirubrobacterales bacterium]